MYSNAALKSLLIPVDRILQIIFAPICRAVEDYMTAYNTLAELIKSKLGMVALLIIIITL
jgi:hypothetical protein